MAATTTVRLSPEDDAILDRAAQRYGSRSAAIRAVLRELDAREQRRQALKEVLDEWEADNGPVDEAGVERMAQYYGMK